VENDDDNEDYDGNEISDNKSVSSRRVIKNVGRHMDTNNINTMRIANWIIEMYLYQMCKPNQQ
jgi:hypothetical protein